jgi:hypothetical protein
MVSLESLSREVWVLIISYEGLYVVVLHVTSCTPLATVPAESSFITTVVTWGWVKDISCTELSSFHARLAWYTQPLGV